MDYQLRSAAQLRLDAAKWILDNDSSLFFCRNNELGKQFLENYELPELHEELTERIIENDEKIILVFQSKITLAPNKSVSGKKCSFIILRYAQALFDDYGNVYRYITLGYCY